MQERDAGLTADDVMREYNCFKLYDCCKQAWAYTKENIC